VQPGILLKEEQMRSVNGYISSSYTQLIQYNQEKKVNIRYLAFFYNILIKILYIFCF